LIYHSRSINIALLWSEDFPSCAPPRYRAVVLTASKPDARFTVIQILRYTFSRSVPYDTRIP